MTLKRLFNRLGTFITNLPYCRRSLSIGFLGLSTDAPNKRKNVFAKNVRGFKNSDIPALAKE